jgi:transposase-like protein
MEAETDEPRKRRTYTTAKRVEIVEAVDDVGVVEAARRHGVPQTTVSNWLHRDAMKVAKEKAAQRAATREGAA